jgi:hypothetical protein
MMMHDEFPLIAFGALCTHLFARDGRHGCPMPRRERWESRIPDMGYPGLSLPSRFAHE